MRGGQGSKGDVQAAAQHKQALHGIIPVSILPHGLSWLLGPAKACS